MGPEPSAGNPEVQSGRDKPHSERCPRKRARPHREQYGGHTGKPALGQRPLPTKGQEHRARSEPVSTEEPSPRRDHWHEHQALCRNDRIEVVARGREVGRSGGVAKDATQTRHRGP